MKELSLIDEYIDRLRSSVDFIKTIDGFLIKLSSIVYDIEDKCSSGFCNSIDLFKELVYSKELNDVFSRFSCYIGEIESIVTRDPRHRILRKYLSILINRLSSLECIEDKRYDTLTPSATWLKERISETGVFVDEKRGVGVKKSVFSKISGIESIWKILFITSVLLIIISLVLLFILR